MSVRSLSADQATTLSLDLRSIDDEKLRLLGCGSLEHVPLRLAYCVPASETSAQASSDPNLSPTPSILGGLSASIFGSYLHVKLLWVSDSVRGQRIGAMLMSRAEEEARRVHRCHFVIVDTMDFQAEGFYLKLGYAQYARLPGAMGGLAERIYLSKCLSDEAPSVPSPKVGRINLSDDPQLDDVIVRGLESYSVQSSLNLPPYDWRPIALRFDEPAATPGTTQGLTGSSGGSFVSLSAIHVEGASLEERAFKTRVLLEELEQIAVQERQCCCVVTEIFDSEGEIIEVLQAVGYQCLHSLEGWFGGRLSRNFFYKSMEHEGEM